MQIADLVTPERVAYGVQAGSKKRALELLSELIAHSRPHLTQGEVFESLIGRERLGSTGLGHGVAIPHGRIKGDTAATGAFIKLDRAVDFDAVDNEPVDLLFALMVPETAVEEHLQILARLAEMFSDSVLCKELREAASDQKLFELLLQWESQHTPA
ncbi:MAG: PTS IIA-like nitrogen regulatory protein PtsN [Gammaproteobacteria bacterium]